MISISSNTLHAFNTETTPAFIDHAILSSIYKHNNDNITLHSPKKLKTIPPRHCNNINIFTKEQLDIFLGQFLKQFFIDITPKLELFVLNSIPKSFVERNERFQKRFTTIWQEKYKSILEMSTLRIINSFLQNYTNADAQEKHSEIIHFIKNEIQSRKLVSQQLIDQPLLESTSTHNEEFKEELAEDVEPIVEQNKDDECKETMSIFVSLTETVEAETLANSSEVDESSTNVSNHSNNDINEEEMKFDFHSLRELPDILFKLFERNILPKFIDESIKLRNEILETISEL